MDQAEGCKCADVPQAIGRMSRTVEGLRRLLRSRQQASPCVISPPQRVGSMHCLLAPTCLPPCKVILEVMTIRLRIIHGRSASEHTDLVDLAPRLQAFQCRAERRRHSGAPAGPSPFARMPASPLLSCLSLPATAPGHSRPAVPCRASAEEPPNAPVESLQPPQQGPEFRDFDRRSAIFAGALAACTAAVAM